MAAPPLAIRISAPGKVILHGEHSVVYDKLAIAASLGRRTHLEFIEIEPESNMGIVDFSALNLLHRCNLQNLITFLNQPLPTLSSTNNYNFNYPEQLNHELVLDQVKRFVQQASSNLDVKQHQALVAFFYLFWGFLAPVEVDLKPFRLKMASELTISAGTGSSASFAVTTAGFFLQYVKAQHGGSRHNYKPFLVERPNDKFDGKELELISKWAFQAEKIIHGTPSGVDNTVCTYGGLVEFRKGTSPKLVEIATEFNLILIDTKVARDTKALVKKGADLRNKYKMIIDGVLQLMDETAQEALLCVRKINRKSDVPEQYDRLGELAALNQNFLRCLGVSHPKLEEACLIVAESGLHAKLTGAGGGGFAISLVPPSMNATRLSTVLQTLNARGFEAVLTKLGGPGVTID